jgi:hypothetical protein
MRSTSRLGFSTCFLIHCCARGPRGSCVPGLCVRAARSSCIASAAIVGGIVGGSTTPWKVAGVRGSRREVDSGDSRHSTSAEGLGCGGGPARTGKAQASTSEPVVGGGSGCLSAAAAARARSRHALRPATRFAQASQRQFAPTAKDGCPADLDVFLGQEREEGDDACRSGRLRA